MLTLHASYNSFLNSVFVTSTHSTEENRPIELDGAARQQMDEAQQIADVSQPQIMVGAT